MKADDERRADDRGDDLRDETGALRADEAKHSGGREHRERGGRRAHGRNDAVGTEPVRAASPGQHVDEGAASGSAMPVTDNATVPMRIAKSLSAATGEARIRSRSARA